MSGPPVTQKCWRCSATVAPGDRYCGECGAVQTSPAQNPPSPAALAPRTPVTPAVQFIEPARGALLPSGAEGPGTHVQNVTVAAPTPGPSPQHNINVYVQHGAGQESPTFAIVTLVSYFVCSPLGMLLNLIGLLTGPKRGCFAAMFVMLFLPFAALFALIAAGFALGMLDANGQGLDQFLTDVESFFRDLDKM